jgi:hypothetical protein
MNPPTNPYIKRLDELEAAKEKWQESEWLLSFLRSEGSEQPKIPTDEEVLQWAKNLH